LPRWVSVLFGGYLLFWTFMVGASLSSACGLVGASIFPTLPVPVWGALHAAIAAALVAANRYARFQRVMKALVAVMALSVLGCALLTRPAPGALLHGLLVPLLPEQGGGAQVLALLGGIGGSVTVICYAYWMRAAAWRGREKLATVRGDAASLSVARDISATARVTAKPARQDKTGRIVIDPPYRIAFRRTSGEGDRGLMRDWRGIPNNAPTASRKKVAKIGRLGLLAAQRGRGFHGPVEVHAARCIVHHHHGPHQRHKHRDAGQQITNPAQSDLVRHSRLRP